MPINDFLGKCGCGKPARYTVGNEEYACNKYMRCPEPGTAVPISEVLADPNHPYYKEVEEVLRKLKSGELTLS